MHFCDFRQKCALKKPAAKLRLAGVGRTKRKAENVYVDHDKYAVLVQLAKLTRIPRAVLWREALDDLLKKYGALEGNDTRT